MKILSLLTLLASATSAQTLTDSAPEQHRLVHRNQLAVRVNALGLSYEGRLVYRYRLYASDSPTLRDNFIGIGPAVGLAPTYGRVGPYVEVQPTSFIGFYGAYEFMQYFGIINNAQSFPTAASEFSDTRLRELGGLPKGDPARSFATNGSMLTIGANLNLRFGPIVVRSMAKFVRADFKLRAGDTMLYDQAFDLLMPNHGFVVLNDLDAMWSRPGAGLTVGVRYSFGIPINGPDQPAVDNSTHRVGPFAAYRFSDHDGVAFNQPTVALAVNWWVHHRYRTGADTSAAIPYLALAFTVVGDLLPQKTRAKDKPEEPIGETQEQKAKAKGDVAQVPASDTVASDAPLTDQP